MRERGELKERGGRSRKRTETSDKAHENSFSWLTCSELAIRAPYLCAHRWSSPHAVGATGASIRYSRGEQLVLLLLGKGGGGGV